jgi:hypothetical protein
MLANTIGGVPLTQPLTVLCPGVRRNAPTRLVTGGRPLSSLGAGHRGGAKIEPAVLFVIGLWLVGGFLTGMMAERYNRNALGWAVAGLALFIVALPMLLMMGPQDRRHSQMVLDVIAARGEVDYDGLAAYTGLDDDTLTNALDYLLNNDMVTPTHTRFRAAGRGLRRRSADAPPPLVARLPEASPEPDATERLRRLAALHAEGLLTDDEYEAKRQQVLDDL